MDEVVRVRLSEGVIINPAEEVSVAEVRDPTGKTHGTMSTWRNARVVVRIGSLLELHVSMLWRYGRCINLS